MPKPVVKDAIIGFRHWRLEGSESLLGNYNRSWKHVEMKATCYKRHRAPMRNCTCGIWCHYRKKDAAFTGLVGAVVCWGRVFPYTRGFRTEYARIIGIEVADDTPMGVLKMAQKLGFPLIEEGKLEAYAGEIGQIIKKPPKARERPPEDSNRMVSIPTWTQTTTSIIYPTGGTPQYWQQTPAAANQYVRNRLGGIVNKLVDGRTGETKTIEIAQPGDILKISFIMPLKNE